MATFSGPFSPHQLVSSDVLFPRLEVVKVENNPEAETVAVYSETVKVYSETAKVYGSK